jgi:uridine phosphorylase
LAALFKEGCTPAITLSAHGFYGPQGRSIRAGLSHPGLNERFMRFSYNGIRLSNYEMESSALYGLSEILGHEAFTVCLILANRTTGEFITDYKRAMQDLIQYILNTITV